MTRGQIAIIIDSNTILTSTEFNGDMYPTEEGHGLDVYNGLQHIDSIEEYKEFVANFNQDKFNYEEELFYYRDESHFDMSKQYFSKWFSDYIYIKNLTDKQVEIIQEDNSVNSINPGQIKIFYFGNEYFLDKNLQLKLDVKRELLYIRENLNYDKANNYGKIWNACVDYDNENHDLYLTDYISEQNYIDDELIEMYIQQNPDHYRLRYFFNNTYLDSIYKLDGYGNLTNVDISDFEYLIDELVEIIDKALQGEISFAM